MTSLAGIRGNLKAAFERERSTTRRVRDSLPDFLEEGEVTSATNEVVPAQVNRYSWAEVTPPDPRSIALRQSQSRPVVRRPTMGLVGYEDRWASIEVVVRSGDGGAGESVELFNSSYASNRSTVNTNFMVQRVDYRKMEAAKVVRTFGDFYLSDVGETPEVLKVQGVLFESRNFPWLSEWKKNFNTYLRARQCILRRAMVYLTIDDTMYVGYIVNTAATRSTDVAWELVPFSFDMILRNVVEVRSVANFPTLSPDNSEAMAQLQEWRMNNGGFTSQLSGAVTDPDSSTLAQLSEIVDGRFPNQIVSLKQPTLEFEGRIDEAAFRVNLDELVRVARAINTQTGREFIDLQNLRSGYLAGRRDEMESMGIPNPEVYGLPSRYQTEVDAQRASAQSEYRRSIENGFNKAEEKLDAIAWW